MSLRLSITGQSGRLKRLLAGQIVLSRLKCSVNSSAVRGAPSGIKWTALWLVKLSIVGGGVCLAESPLFAGFDKRESSDLDELELEVGPSSANVSVFPGN